MEDPRAVGVRLPPQPLLPSFRDVSSTPWVLVVDDDAALRDAAAAGLSESGFRVRTAGTAIEAVAELMRTRYEAVVLDVELAGSSGFDVHKILAQRDDARDIAVLFVSGQRVDESTAIEALEAGACDFLRKPFGIRELAVRIAAAIAARRTLAELRRIGSIDELTGVLNRRAFFEALERERRRSNREASTLAMIVLDVDRFKSVNDRFGHAVGDAALQAVGAVLSRSCRVTDVVGRIGGEEFAIALPSTDEAGARGLAEKLRAAIADIQVPLGNGQILALTASFGTAAAHGDSLGPPDGALAVLALADGALYRAKAAGRDRVEAA